jgi:hypothetical protein
MRRSSAMRSASSPVPAAFGGCASGRLNRESHYKALGEAGNREFSTMLGVMRALGLELSARPIAQSSQI